MNQPTPSPQRISPDDNKNEHSRGLAEREGAGADGGDRKSKKDERGGVVGEAFALENDENAPRKLHSARNRERRHGVGRRNNGAGQKTDRPGKSQQPARRHCDGERW